MSPNESGQSVDTNPKGNDLEVLHTEKAVDMPHAGADYSGAHGKTDPLEIRLVRKVDLIMLPTLWLMYWFNYLDRNAITVAVLDGIDTDLGLSSTQYQTCISILFVGYILGQVPANMIITRVRPSIFLAGMMALWSIVSALTAITHDFKGLLLTRFFLGVVEAPFYPGALYLFSMFYTRKEIATRIAILFTGNICGTAFAGLLAIGIFQMEGVAGLSGWRWLFIIQGVISFAIAVVAAFILPNEPLQTRWLTADERQLAHERIARDTVLAREDTSTLTGLRDAVKDGKLWLLVLLQHLHFAATGYKNFFPTIVGTLGFSTNVTLALTCPPYLIAGAVTIAYSWNSGRMNERTWHITIGKTVAIFGFVLACSTLNVGARYFAMCVFASGTYSVNSLTLGWVVATCCQTKEKKSISLAIVSTISSLAPIYTPYLWPETSAPRYTMAMAASAAFCAGAIVVTWIMRAVLVRENRKIQRSGADTIALYAY